MKGLESVESWVPGLAVGQYTLVRELARGGMGEIWLARQVSGPGFDRLVVLKRVIAGEDDASFLTMFLDEARIASHLHHPNVVQVFELGQQRGSTFLVMEYLTGQTVSRLARRFAENKKRLPPRLAVELVDQAAKGLGYAHRRRDLEGKPLHIVHRDVSPQNLFVTYEGAVKVLDFGIARAAGRLARTSTGVVKGKMAYMAPEQAMSEGVGGAADVFSLGVVLYELITGARLYRVQDDVAILRLLAAQTVAPRASEKVEIDPELDELIARMLDPVPERRFTDGQALHEALEKWLREHPLAANEPSLEQTMHAAFAVELGSLEEFHRQAARTPSEVSMPDRQSGAKPATGRRWVVISAALATVAAVFGGVGLSRVNQQAATDAVKAPPVVVVDAKPAIDAGPPSVVEVIELDAGVAPVAEVRPPVVDAGTPVAAVAAPAPARTGTLTLSSEPWTKVMLGKRSLGDTPLINVKLPAGKHRLRLINEAEKINTEIEVTITAGSETVKKLAF